MAALGLRCVLHPALEPLPSVYDDFNLKSLAHVIGTTLAGVRLIYSGIWIACRS